MPAWLLYSAWSKGWDAFCRSSSTGSTQTELNMQQLDKLMVILAENEDAVCSHRQLLEVSREENQALRTDLEGAMARLALMSQHNADLEQYNQRLFGVLRDVVLPVFERLTHVPEADDVPNITAEVLVALHSTKQLLSEAEGAYCATAEPSPAEKPGEVSQKNTPRGDASVQVALLPLRGASAGPESSPLEGCARGFLSARQPNNAAQGVAKVLSFASPSRSTAVVHVLAHDI
ncbi:hypothetical protein PLESTM_000778900 [Pleodorina starrii]|nr:hypothetical protein PLESTM_000778900 [Pleodorina starrii]